MADKSRLSKIAVFALMFAVLVTGCKQKYPSDILQPGEIEPVLFDIMVAAQLKQIDTSSATRQHLKDSTTAEIKRVLAAHNIDDSLYFRTMAYYEAHPDYLKKVIDSARSYGSWLQDSLQRKLEKSEKSKKDSLAQDETKNNLKAKHPRDSDSTQSIENATVKDSAAHPVENVKNSGENK